MKTTRHKPYTMANSKLSTGSAMLVRYCMFFALLLMGVSASFAQVTKTSTGSASWGIASTWSPSGVPAANDHVVIAASHTVTLSAAVTTTGNLTVNGTLDRGTRNMTAGSLSGASTGVITSTGGSLTVGSNNSPTTYAGKISGSTNARILDKRGTGTLTLTGNSDFTGGNVNVTTGTLRLGVAGALPTTAVINVYNGGTFDLNGFNQTVKYLSDGSTTLNPASPVAIVTNSSATAATLTLGTVGADEYSSFGSTMTGKLNMVVNDGMYLSGSGFGTDVNVSVSNGANLELGLLPSTTTVLGGNLSVASGGKVGLVQNATCKTLTLGATLQAAGTYGSTASSATTKNNTFFEAPLTGVLTATSGSSPCLLKTSTKTGNWSDPTVWTPAGVPASCDNVRILATHTVTLTGNTLINGNGLGERLTVLGTLNTAGYNLTVNGAITAGTTTSPSGPRTINTGSGGVVTQNWHGTQQTSILITGSGGFTKLGSGATSFNRDQTYTGVTTIGAGATLGIGFNTTTGSISSSSIVNDGTLNLNRSNAYTLAANISGTGNVNKWRNSTVTLSGNNTYTGTTTIGGSVSIPGGGTLVIANANALPAATSVIFSTTNPGKMQLNANVSCASLLYGAVTQPNGSYGSTSSSATNQNNTYFSVSGTGVLNAGLFLVPSTFPGGTSIQGRARWGATGYEGGLFIGGTVGPQLNPTGTPVWVIGTAYTFQYGYNGITGYQTLSIDFNGNNTFDASEVITQYTGFAGQGFQHFSIFMSGDATRSISLNNFVVNGVNLGNFVSPTSGSLDLDWVNPSGNFSNITATGTITFTGATGGSAETGRIWFRTAVPQPLMMAITESVTEYGSANSMAADNAASAVVSLYPNPTVTGRVSFRVPMAGLRSNGGALSSTVEAIDYAGSVKLSRKVTIDAAGRGELDASSLTSGAYILRVSVAGRVFTTRMVRQ